MSLSTPSSSSFSHTSDFISSSSSSFVSVQTLPEDVIVQIALFTPFASLLPMRLTCSRLNQILTEPLLYKLRYYLEFGRYFQSSIAHSEELPLQDFVLKYIDTYFEKKAWRFDEESESVFFHLMNDSVQDTHAFLLNKNQDQNVLNQSFVSQEFGHNSLLGGFHSTDSVAITATYNLSKQADVRTVTQAADVPQNGSAATTPLPTQLALPPNTLSPHKRAPASSCIPVRCFQFTPNSPNYPSYQFMHDDCPFLQYNDLKHFHSTNRAWIGLTKENFLRGSLHGVNIKPYHLTPYSVIEITILSKKHLLIWATTSSGQKILLFQLKETKLELIRERPVKHMLAAGQQKMATNRIGQHLYVCLSNPAKCNIQVTDMSSDSDKWTTCPLPKKIRKREMILKDIVDIQAVPYIMVAMGEQEGKSSLLLFIDNNGSPMPSTAKLGKIVDDYWVYKNMLCVHVEKKRELRVLRFLPDRKTGVFIEDVFYLNLSQRFHNPCVAFDQAKFVLFRRRELIIYCIKTGKLTRKFDLKELDTNEWDHFLARDVEQTSIDLLSGRWIDLFFKGAYQSLWLRIEHPEI